MGNNGSNYMVGTTDGHSINFTRIHCSHNTIDLYLQFPAPFRIFEAEWKAVVTNKQLTITFTPKAGIKTAWTIQSIIINAPSNYASSTAAFANYAVTTNQATNTINIRLTPPVAGSNVSITGGGSQTVGGVTISNLDSSRYNVGASSITTFSGSNDSSAGSGPIDNGNGRYSIVNQSNERLMIPGRTGSKKDNAYKIDLTNAQNNTVHIERRVGPNNNNATTINIINSSNNVFYIRSSEGSYNNNSVLINITNGSNNRFYICKHIGENNDNRVFLQVVNGRENQVFVTKCREANNDNSNKVNTINGSNNRILVNNYDQANNDADDDDDSADEDYAPPTEKRAKH